MDIRNILLITPSQITHQLKDTLWTLEESIKSGAAAAVLGWPQQMSVPQARRLQMCASQYQVPCFLFKQQPIQEPIAATPCALRLQLKAITHDAVEIDILKQRHGWPSPPFCLAIKRYSPFRYANSHINNTLNNCGE